jgi:hypothetical protein
MHDLAALHSVAVSHWALCALVVTLRFGLTGAAWLWLFPRSIVADFPKPGRLLVLTATAWLVGVVTTLLTTLALAEFGRAGGRTEFLISTGWIVAGLVLGAATRMKALSQALRDVAPGLAATFVVVAAVMNLPGCGEWITGGWDPGVYLNQGLAVARTGTFHPAPQACHAALDSEGLRAFVRQDRAYMEIYPGVPINPDTRRVEHYFFRLTPTLIGVLAQSGGLRAAVRVNYIMGAFTLIAFMAFLYAHRCGWPQALFATALLAAQPLWLYHLHLPISELLELFLFMGIGTLAAFRTQSLAASTLIALSLFAAIVNRFSFLPFAGLMLCALAWADIPRTDRRRVLIERVLQLAAVVAGALFDIQVTAISTTRLPNIVRNLTLVAGVFAAIAMLLDVAAWKGWAQDIEERLPAWSGPALCAAGLLGLAGLWLLRHTALLSPEWSRLQHLLPYFGAVPMLLALGGAAWLCCCGDRVPRTVKALALVFLGMAIIVLIKPFMVPIYPWATRRHLTCTLPLLALLGGAVLALPWTRTVKFAAPAKALALVVLIGAVASTAKRSWHAWSRTEYNGLSDALALVAGQIGDRDVVVVDHPWWGTPLTFIYGKQILDGRNWYAGRNTNAMEVGMATLTRLHAEGQRIRFLTSTAEGLSVYPRPVQPVAADWSSPEFALNAMIHGPRVADFVTREKRYVFQLYTFEPNGAGP